MLALFRLSVFIALLWYGTGCARSATVLDVTLRISKTHYPVTAGAQNDSILDKNLFNEIKRFILAQGLRQTYCSMFGNNPAYFVESCSYYLNPDTGQENIDCDPEKSDFDTLVIRNRDWGRDQYRHVFVKEGDPWLYVSVSSPADDLNVGRIRDKAVEALGVIRTEMERLDYAPASNPPVPDKPAESAEADKPAE